MCGFKALIFDVDGTLADTERDGHRPAFNAAFAEAGLDWVWDPVRYGELLAVAGGRERIRHFMEREGIRLDPALDADAFVAELHHAKTQHYLALLRGGAIPLRSGVRRLLHEAHAAGIRLAIATTATRESVLELLDHSGTPGLCDWFEVIVAGDAVAHKKPAPDIYHLALAELGLKAADCVAVEDSDNGARAALAAGIRAVLITVNDDTVGQDFGAASLVVDRLGEPDEPARALVGDLGGQTWVDLAVLDRMHSGVEGAGHRRFAPRAQAVEPFHVMRLLAQARELEAAGRSIVHLEIGEPDFPTPAPILAAGQRALAAGQTHYTPAAGLPALRQAIADYYGRRYRVTVAPTRILVTPGASGALQLVFAALLEPGDRVLIGDPSYPCYRQVLRLMGVEPVAAPLGPEDDFQLTAARAAAAWVPGIRAVVVASPANPTGSVLSADTLAGLHALCRARGAVLIVDEIYQGLIYEACDETALVLGSRDLYVINSFSKYFGMTGWRVGWIAAPDESVEVMERLAQNLFIATNTPAQHAALAAFDAETLAIIEERRETFRERRDRLLPALRELGFVIPNRPAGAFYLYAGLPPQVTLDAMDFATRLLTEAGVAVTPGQDFGALAAGRHVRFAYTRDLCELDEGIRRLGDYLSGGASR